jgi:hypothetical protein
MIFFGVVLLAPTLGTVIESVSSRYLVCSSPQHGGASEVFETTMTAKSQALESCDATNQRVIVKCSKIGPLPLFEVEYKHMTTLESSRFTPRPIEFFNKDGDETKPCMSMEMLGVNLESLRFQKPGMWPSATLGSIGIQLLTIGSALHNTYGLLHRDLHAGNICLERSNSEFSRNLFLIDLGDMRPMQSDDRGSAHSDRLDEVRQIVLTIRFLLDGDRKYYVTKRYIYDEGEICQGSVPLPLCEALRYVFSLPGDSSSVDYDSLIHKMNQLTDNTYSGSVIWNPYIEAAVGIPDLRDSFALRPVDFDHADTPIDTTEFSGGNKLSSNVNQSVMGSTSSSRDPTKAAAPTEQFMLFTIALITIFAGKP